MEFEKNIKNELFNRQEISFELESDKNPEFSESYRIFHLRAGEVAFRF